MMNIGYITYTVLLLVLTGGLILFIDVKSYARKEMKKEEKTARFTGWFNVSLGTLLFIANWAFQKWFY